VNYYNLPIYIYILAGGLGHGFYDFPIILGTIIPFDELIFFRGVETTNQYIYIFVMVRWVYK